MTLEARNILSHAIMFESQKNYGRKTAGQTGFYIVSYTWII